MYTINLLSTYSKLGKTNAICSYPNVHLSPHQQKTVDLLNDQTVEIIFNTAMTGDGKSLAAYWRSITEKNYEAIGLYPTNELARDQESQIISYINKFSTIKPKPNINRVTSKILREHEKLSSLSKQTRLISLVESAEIVVSNPDIYHYVFNLFYRRPTQNPDIVFQRLIQNFKLTIFDEFHIFRSPQITSVINILLLIRASEGIGKRKFLFLSATPSPLILEMLNRANINYKEIKGEYYHADDSNGDKPDISEWRRILHSVKLNFDIVKMPDKTVEAWVKENFETNILSFFQRNKGAKGAIIVNSVASAKRLTEWLAAKMTQYKFTVISNTGADSESTRKASYDADLLVGTSTIDVGVDFKINFLVFEALDAGSFIQRFGRLGRHDGYNRNGEYIEFETYQAYALLPEYICKRLFEPDTGLLADNNTYNREAFFEIIRDERIFSLANDFRLYSSKWGQLQAVYILRELNNSPVKNAYSHIFNSLQNNYENALNIKMINALKKLIYFTKTDDKKLIFQEAISFRGTSSLLCGIQDDSENNVQERFKTYDLPLVISNWEILEVIAKKEFHERAEKAGCDLKEFENCILFLRIGRLREESIRWRFFINRNLLTETYDLNVQVGLEVSTLPGYQLDHINKINAALCCIKIVSYIIRDNPQEIKIRRHLPTLFGLYPLSDMYTQSDPKPSFSIAFGQEALMLSTLYWKKTAEDDTAIIC